MKDMSESNDRRLDDIISSLNNIREEMDATLRASQSDEFNKADEAGRDEEEDPGTLALQDYLASRLEQIGEVIPEKREFKDLRTGNGWDTTKVIEQAFKIEPISMKRAVEIATSAKKKLTDRIRDAFLGRKEELRVVEPPVIDFVPIWKVKGFHECYYLRSGTYKVNVKDDVVAVEVEGHSRDLILERKHRKFIPTAILERFQKFVSFLSRESKYFVISEATELATKRSESQLVMSGSGRMLSPDEEATLTSWRAKRIFDTAELKVRGSKARIQESRVSKEALLERFREQVVHMPDRFKKILSNRLEITELKRIYIPIVRVLVQKGLVPTEVIVNGSSGELADTKLLELLE